MGLFYADFELINGDDLALVRCPIIGEEEVKRMRVNALVGTGLLCFASIKISKSNWSFPSAKKEKANWMMGASLSTMSWHR